MRPLRSSRLYIRIILLYTISAVSIVFLLSSVLISRSQRFLEEQLDRVRQEEISQLKIYLDENVFIQPREALINGYFSFSWDYLLPRFFQNEIRDAYDLVRLHGRIKEILLANPYLESISLLRFPDQRLISTRYGIINLDEVNKGHRDDVLSVDSFLDRGERWGWFGNERLVSFYQRIPFNPAGRETGIMVVSFKTAALEAECRRLAGDAGVRIIGPDGTLIAKFDPLERMEEKRRTFEVRSESSGVLYELSVPDGFFLHDLHAARRYLVAAAAGVLVLGVILLDLLTSLLYTPFIRIIARITRLQGEGDYEETAGELRRADEYLDRLDGREEEREHILSENLSLNRYKMMMSIADGDFSELDLARMETLCRITFPHSWFSLIIASPPDGWLGNKGTAHGELLDHDLVRAVEDFMIIKCGWQVLVVSPRTAHLHMLVNSSQPILPAEAGRLRDVLASQFGITYSLNLSSPKLRLGQVCDAFREAVLAGAYRFYFGARAVMIYDRKMDSGGRGGDECHYQALEKAKKHLNALDIRGLSVLIDRMLAEAVESLTPPARIKEFLLQIYNDAAVMHARLAGEHEAVDETCSLMTAAGMKSCILSLAEKLEALSETEHKDRERRFLETVREHIAAEVDACMSLESVADRFGVSAGHLGRLLRRHQSGGFKELLLRSKLDRAVRLLEGGDQTVKEISAGLGYSSPAYFARIFRERYGVAPADFRRDRRCSGGGRATP